LYSELGGRKIIIDVFIWAKEANPSVKLYIVDEPILDTNNDAVRQNVANFLQLLEYLKKIGTPIDGVETENNFWIYAPPNKQNMKTLLSQIKDKGYEIVAPEMVVAISDKFPVWPERPRTVQSISNKLVAQAEIYRETLEAYLEVGCSQFGLFSGTDAITLFTEIGYPDAESEILDKNYQPKPAYYSLWDVLLKYALQRQPSATTAPHMP